MKRAELSDFADRWWGPASLLLGIAGCAFGAWLIHYDKGATAPSRSFSSTFQFTLWVLLIAGQTALWFALAPPLAAFVRRREMHWTVWLKVLLFVAALLALFLSEFYELPADFPLEHHSKKMMVFNIVGGGVALLAIIGIWQTQWALEKLHASLSEKREVSGPGGAAPGHPAAVATFLGLREEMERCLLAAGVIIGAATLATGGLRNAMLAYCPGAYFPREAVLGYGLLFSGILALVYAPAYVWLVRVRSLLREKLAPLPAQPPPSWAGWNTERKAVDELLQVQSGITSFAGAVSILTPLLGSLLPVLFGAGK